MKKSIYTMLLFFLVLGFATSPAMAHTGLESSSPAEGEVIKEALQEITLTFEGKIEKTSSFSLINEKGEKMSVSDIAVTDHQLTGTVENLPNGAYLIEWNIIGADGHPIQGTIPFSQDAAISKSLTEAPSEDSSIEEEHISSQESGASPADSDESSSNTWVYMIVVAIVVALLVLFLRSRKNDGLH